MGDKSDARLEKLGAKLGDPLAFGFDPMDPVTRTALQGLVGRTNQLEEQLSMALLAIPAIQGDTLVDAQAIGALIRGLKTKGPWTQRNFATPNSSNPLSVWGHYVGSFLDNLMTILTD